MAGVQLQEVKKSKKRILLTTYYGLREALLAAKCALERVGYLVDEYPLFRWSSDAADKRADYVTHFANCIASNNPDIILFWCLTISSSGLRKIRADNPHRKFVLYNWDDPHCWTLPENEMVQKAPCFDLVFSCCLQVISSILTPWLTLFRPASCTRITAARRQCFWLQDSTPSTTSGRRMTREHAT